MNNQHDRSPGFTPKGSPQTKIFLEGPHSRKKEFFFLLSVVREFIKGFRNLHFTGPCVTVFGSARFDEQNEYYQAARAIGQEIARLGFTVMTGGGPGIMEAANRGAKEAGGFSVGCNIVLAHEQHPNRYLDKWVDIDYFFVRKVLLTKYSYGFVVMPGGYGTMDEFFESIELIQTGKMKRFPIVLFGKHYHEELFAHLLKMKAERTIDEQDLELFLLTDSVQEAADYLRRHAVEGFDLKQHRKFRPFGILGEAKFRRKSAPMAQGHPVK
jgi:uncharacterized protein (TIGR00730 family)